VQVHYGQVEALKGITVTVDEGEIVTLIGANGAGKTTTMKTISGLRPVRAGTVTFNGKDITGTAAHKVVRQGMALVPEGRKIFFPLTVEENLRVGAYSAPRSSVEKGIGVVYEKFPVLAERSQSAAGLLSGGEQQMLAFGRALMSQPRLMLLDEPSMGLAPTMVDRVLSSVRTMADEGIGILMVEQNADAGLRIADHVVVLKRGETVWTGSAAEARGSKAIVHAMLGEAALDGA